MNLIILFNQKMLDILVGKSGIYSSKRIPQMVPYHVLKVRDVS